MGIAEIWGLVQEFRDFTEANGFFQRHRQNQSRYWLHETIQQFLREQFYQDPQVAALLNEKEAEVLLQKQSPFHAAEDLVRLFLKLRS
jgi:LAO/AO transport system kinase